MERAKNIFDEEKSNNLHLSILQDVSQVVNFSENFQETLSKIVNLVAKKLTTDVCSIYLLNPDDNILTLQATKGLNVSSEGKIKLKIGEGVTSLAIEKMKPIFIENAQEHPRFIKFSEAQENDFNSFLAIPITDNKKAIGVFVVQKREKYIFSINEINMLQILAAQISSVIQVAHVLEKTIRPPEIGQDNAKDDNTTEVEKIETPKKVLSFQGQATSFGYGYGQIILLEERHNFSIITNYKIKNIRSELKTFDKAIKQSRKEISQIKQSLKKQISHDILKIFDSHIMLINDRKLQDKIISLIREGNNAAYATLQVINLYIKTFENFTDPYIKERTVDIEDIGNRIINNILGLSSVLDLSKLPEKCVIVSKFLTPSTTANLDVSKVSAIVTEHGGKTSHASILARSLEIPAVVLPHICSKVNSKDYLLVDGNTGFVFLNPQKALIDEYEKKAELEVEEFHNYFLQYVEDNLRTEDNIPINIGVNIGIFSDIKIAQDKGVKDVGLFRTEFIYMMRNRLPSVDEQQEIYKNIVSSFPSGEITIRTIDIGGDKLLSYLPMQKEENPCLGYKSSRFLLDHPKILFEQLKAILMASAHGKIRILFPMISSLNEIIQLKDFLEIAKGTLTYNKIDFDDNIEVGMMIEVPSIIFQLDSFIKEVDFFSIGTNDLIQYLLAVDRDNEKVSNIYNPLHPAVIRAIDSIVQQTINHKDKRITVCGEMAGPTETTFVLLALGIRDFSSSPASIPYLHYLTKQVNKNILEETRKAILSFANTTEIEIYIQKTLRKIAPKLYL